MAALPLSFLSLHTMLTPTPEGKVSGSLIETGQGLQFTGEDRIHLASQTISLLLSHKKVRLPSLEQAILLMIHPHKAAIQLILPTLLYITQLLATVQ